MTVALLTLAAAGLTQSGFILWKVAGSRLPAVGRAPFGATLRAFLTSPLWWLATVAAAGGWLLLVKAVSLGEISVVQPLMSVGDLLLVAVAVLFFRERLSRPEWLGLAVTVVGAVVLGSQAREIEPARIGWAGLAAFLGGVAAVGLGAILSARRTRTPELPLACGVGAAFGTGALLTELMTAHSRLGGLGWEPWPALLNPWLPAVLAANVAGLVLLQVALQRGRAAVVVPVQLALINALVVAGGWGAFGEPLAPLKLAGIGGVVTGAVLLGRAKIAGNRTSAEEPETDASSSMAEGGA